jgi:formylglycine-generating enzyme required for sulfatase activity
VEEAGCDNFALLHHLRYGDPHRVECWALRRLLRTTLALPGGVEMAFAWCPPGVFLMGSPESEAERDDDEQQHEVRITKGFYAGVHPVTQAEWSAVMNSDPSHFKGATLPVESVSWEDAQAFCATVRELTGKPVRLPTEAEWEYACRGGTATPFFWGSELNGTQANCDGNSPYGTEATGPYLEATSPVGKYAGAFPHPWGLTDVHGNVWEWCANWYDAGFYARSPTDDPEGRDGEQKYRVLRGGSWNYFARLCRAALRCGDVPANRDGTYGFRVVFCLD